MVIITEVLIPIAKNQLYHQEENNRILALDIDMIGELKDLYPHIISSVKDK